MILRDKDANTGWTTLADSTREERNYFCQNWRGDVVNVITSDGKQFESDRYSSYGVPFGSPCGDYDGDGDTDASDQTAIAGIIAVSGYSVRADLDLDGDVDSADQTRRALFDGQSSGRLALSLDPDTVIGGGSGGNRFGYAAYVWDRFTSKWHVRHRVLDPETGRWSRHDPLGYVDGANLYAYVRLNPILRIDSWGLSGEVFTCRPGMLNCGVCPPGQCLQCVFGHGPWGGGCDYVCRPGPCAGSGDQPGGGGSGSDGRGGGGAGGGGGSYTPPGGGGGGGDNTRDCCGLSVDRYLRPVLNGLRARWNAISTAQQAQICSDLGNWWHIFPGGGGGDPLPPAAAAWDIDEFFQGSQVFTSGPCGSGYCKGTVTFGGGCYKTGWVNYILFGQAAQLCGWTQQETIDAVVYYNLIRHPFDIGGRHAKTLWANTGFQYHGGTITPPLLYTYAACHACTQNYSGSLFVYVGYQPSGSAIAFTVTSADAQ